MKRVADTVLTPRMVLRRPRGADLAAYTAYCTSDRTRFAGGPFTAQNAYEKFAQMIGQWEILGYGRWVMEFNGDPIGHVGPLSGAGVDTPEMTWTLWSAGHEGKGLATEAARAAVHHLMTDCLWPDLRILIAPANRASIRVAERIGAQATDEPAPEWAPGYATYRLTVAA